MFVNFNEKGFPATVQADICLVGSGVMGLALASRLSRRAGLRILLVEQGGLIDTDALSAVPEEWNDGDVTSGVIHSRAMGFGGSSRRWGGEALPFLPLDLSDRPLVTPRGPWPITYDELLPYYREAADFLALSATPFDTDLWRHPTLARWFGEHQPLTINFSKHSPKAYLARYHHQAIARSTQVTCLLNAKVVAVQLDSDGQRAEGVRVRSLAGQEAFLRARTVVLCGGGIENPRLLLASWQGERRGVGNGQDLVGRFYQDHVGFYGARLRPLNRRLFTHLLASFLTGRQKYLPKLQLSPAYQRAHDLLNVTGNIAVEESDQSPLQTLRRVRRLLGAGRRDPGARATLADVARLLQAPFALLPVVASTLRGRVHLPREAAFFLIGNAESEPLADSRVLLSDQRDGHGLERPLVRWRVSDRTLEALRAYFVAVKQTLEGAGIAEVTLTPSLTDPTLDWKAKAYSLYHHMGATRMAHSPREGVVDANGQVHGVHNLYIAGTSVLPTGSASNPTFTALALTLRLAEHLASRAPS
jgi:choline dehydrogenase-like flavoprotein